jgi:tRNA(Ile)-lysidine synthase
LRPEAAHECEFVIKQANTLGLPSVVLSPLEAPLKHTGLQAWARHARYESLRTYMAKADLSLLITAHTCDDQAETILMRLAAGSGLAGLRGMRSLSEQRGCAIFRPFLNVSKLRLLATCHAKNIPFINDPSNQNSEFTRVRWRALMPQFAQEGLTRSRLSTFSRRCEEADHALEHYASQLVMNARQKTPFCHWQISTWTSAPFAVVLKAMTQIIVSVEYEAFISKPAAQSSLRLQRLEDLTRAILAYCSTQERITPFRRTLKGYLVQVDRHGRLRIHQAPLRRHQQPV